MKANDLDFDHMTQKRWSHFIANQRMQFHLEPEEVSLLLRLGHFFAMRGLGSPPAAQGRSPVVTAA